jgi:methyl-accepting chemotaxis protein
MNLSKMTVGKRLGLGFALVLIFLIALTIVGVFRMSQIQGRLEKS